MGGLCALEKNGSEKTVCLDQQEVVRKSTKRPTTPVIEDDNAEWEAAPISRFVGSYGKLKSFIKRCKDTDVVGEAHYNDLIEALEDVSDHGKNKDRKTTLHNPKFQGGFSIEELQQGLQLMEIQSKTPSMDRRISLNESQFIVALREGATEYAELLAEPAFDCMSRGNVPSPVDIQVVTYGFTAPYNVVGRYQMNAMALETWATQIAGRYIANPYHNWRHAFDVYQFIHCSLAKGGAGEFFNFQDILALLASAIAHDVGHVGTNNAFLVNTGAKLAIIYNDLSPLENMHASVCFETLAQPNCNWTECFKESQKKNVRSKVIECILATDMSHHFELVDKFQSRVIHAPDIPFKQGTKDDREKQKETKEDRRLLMRAFTHMADLGHCVRPWPVHRLVVCVLEEEFFKQGDQERALGLAISPLMDRLKDSAAAGQNFFLDKLVRPLFDPYCHFLSEEMASYFKDTMSYNQQNWTDLVQTFGKLSANDLIHKKSGTAQIEENGKTDVKASDGKTDTETPDKK